MSRLLRPQACTTCGGLALVLLLSTAVVACSREPAPAAATPADAADPEPRAAAVLPRSGAAADLRFLTGARTRVVWVQSDGTDPYAAGNRLVLMGFDTDSGKGERPVLSTPASYVKPMFTPRGDRVVFSTRPTDPGGPKVFLVNWDGSGLRELGPGFALAVRAEPGTGREWLYVGTDAASDAPYNFRTVTSAPLDDPAARQLAWNKTPVSGDTFQVSADGRTAGGLFPWPHAGVVGLPNGDLHTVGDGCWTALGEPGVPVLWYFDGAHRNITMSVVGADRRWAVPLNQAPGFDNAEVYHPRWTNHPRILAISGPYNQGGTNQVRSGGTQSEIYVGRFDERYTRVEAWVRVTSNGSGDSYPDVWIDRARSEVPVRPPGPIGPRAGAADAGASPKQPGAAATAGRVVLEARLATAAAIPSPRSIAPYRNALVVNGYDVVQVVEGDYRRDHILVAQWAIKDAKVLPGAQQRTVGSTMRLTVSPYGAHPELEGERLIAQSGGPDLPLYYDVGSRP